MLAAETGGADAVAAFCVVWTATRYGEEHQNAATIVA